MTKCPEFGSQYIYVQLTVRKSSQVNLVRVNSCSAEERAVCFNAGGNACCVGNLESHHTHTVYCSVQVTGKFKIKFTSCSIYSLIHCDLKGKQSVKIHTKFSIV
jgi:hypothetical protein